MVINFVLCCGLGSKCLNYCCRSDTRTFEVLSWHHLFFNIDFPCLSMTKKLQMHNLSAQHISFTKLHITYECIPESVVTIPVACSSLPVEKYVLVLSVIKPMKTAPHWYYITANNLCSSRNCQCYKNAQRQFVQQTHTARMN